MHDYMSFGGTFILELSSSLSYNRENRFSRFRPLCLMSQKNYVYLF